MPTVYINEWPPFSPADSQRRKNALTIARMMVGAAFTAPKAGGMPQIEALIAHGQDELEKIATKMEELQNANPKNRLFKNMMKSEAVMVRESDAIVFLGNYRLLDPVDFSCGNCGGDMSCDWLYSRRVSKHGFIDPTEKMSDWLVDGPICTYRAADLGYAMASAVNVAQRLFVDVRPFMSVGLAAQKLGYLPKSTVVVGIPIASLSKNPYVDILPDYHMHSLERMVDSVRKFYPVVRQVMWFDYRSWDPMGPASTEDDEEEDK